MGSARFFKLLHCIGLFLRPLCSKPTFMLLRSFTQIIKWHCAQLLTFMGHLKNLCGVRQIFQNLHCIGFFCSMPNFHASQKFDPDHEMALGPTFHLYVVLVGSARFFKICIALVFFFKTFYALRLTFMLLKSLTQIMKWHCVQFSPLWGACGVREILQSIALQ